MSDLPVLKPIDPIARCGVCAKPVYPDGRCQAEGPEPSSCPLGGDEWHQYRINMHMRNAATTP